MQVLMPESESMDVDDRPWWHSLTSMVKSKPESRRKWSTSWLLAGNLLDRGCDMSHSTFWSPYCVCWASGVVCERSNRCTSRRWLWQRTESENRRRIWISWSTFRLSVKWYTKMYFLASQLDPKRRIAAVSENCFEIRCVSLSYWYATTWTHYLPLSKWRKSIRLTVEVWCSTGGKSLRSVSGMQLKCTWKKMLRCSLLLIEFFFPVYIVCISYRFSVMPTILSNETATLE